MHIAHFPFSFDIFLYRCSKSYALCNKKYKFIADSENLIGNFKERIDISDWHNVILTDSYRNLIHVMNMREDMDLFSFVHAAIFKIIFRVCIAFVIC
jgi:hypothetical protein